MQQLSRGDSSSLVTTTGQHANAGTTAGGETQARIDLLDALEQTVQACTSMREARKRACFPWDPLSLGIDLEGCSDEVRRLLPGAFAATCSQVKSADMIKLIRIQRALLSGPELTWTAAHEARAAVLVTAWVQLEVRTRIALQCRIGSHGFVPACRVQPF